MSSCGYLLSPRYVNLNCVAKKKMIWKSGVVLCVLSFDLLMLFSHILFCHLPLQSIRKVRLYGKIKKYLESKETVMR